MSTKAIGFMLAVQGIYSLLAQLFLFPRIVKCFGELKAFRMVSVSFPLLHFLTPYTVLLPERLQQPALYGCLLGKITAHVIAFPSINLLLTNSAPSMLVLGMVNGAGASTASLSRALGPTVSGTLQALGNKLGYVGLAFWVCGIVSTIGAAESFFMREGGGRFDHRATASHSDNHPPHLHEIEAALKVVEITTNKT